MASIRISSARSELPRAGRSVRSVVAIVWPTHSVSRLARASPASLASSVLAVCSLQCTAPGTLVVVYSLTLPCQLPCRVSS